MALQNSLNLGYGTAGQVLVSNGPSSLPTFQAPPQPSNQVVSIRDDFVQLVGSSPPRTLHFIGSAYTGSGGFSSSPTMTTTNGVFGSLGVYVVTNSPIDIYACYCPVGIAMGCGEITVEWRIAQDSVLAGGSDYMNFAVGLTTGSNGSSTIANTNSMNGLYFFGEYSGTYRTISCASMTSTVNTFSGNSENNNWNIFKIVVNAAGTSVAYYYNGTLVNTHTTNLVSSGTLLNAALVVRKVVGSGWRMMYMDYCNITVNFTNPR